MSPPDDTPHLPRLARWSEWWFTPRWRALLTWFALTNISLMLRDANYNRFVAMTLAQIAYLNRFLASPLPPVFNNIAFSLNHWLLFIWFQPFALRLSLRRGLAWIGLPLGAEILGQVLYSSGHHGESTWYAIRCVAATLQCWVFLGWRSRPWMCLPAWAASSRLLMKNPPQDLDFVAFVFLYAVLLLYGTRLLRPEERAVGRAAD